MNETTEVKKDVYAIATEHVLEHLELGRIPWLTQWSHAGVPQNLVTQKEFKEINVFLLAALGYSKNFFLTPKQLGELGGTAKQSEKMHPVFYWKWPDEKEVNGQEKRQPWLRYYNVYNVEQCNGIKKDKIPKVDHSRNPLEMCIGIVGNMPNCPTIQHGVLPASYLSTVDCIDIPKKEEFPNDESYYCTLFRTLIHSTGHESRLNRKEVMAATITDIAYHRTEDLIAEIGAAYLSSFAGIQYGGAIDPARLEGWIEKLKKDSHLIVYASTQAQRAVDYILNRKKEFKKTESASQPS